MTHLHTEIISRYPRVAFREGRWQAFAREWEARRSLLANPRGPGAMPLVAIRTASVSTRISRFTPVRLSFLAHFESWCTRTLTFPSAYFGRLIQFLSTVSVNQRIEAPQSIVGVASGTTADTATPVRLVNPIAPPVVHRSTTLTRERTVHGATALSVIRRDALRLLTQYHERFRQSTVESHQFSRERHSLAYAYRVSTPGTHSVEKRLSAIFRTSRYLDQMASRMVAQALVTPIVSQQFTIIARSSMTRINALLSRHASTYLSDTVRRTHTLSTSVLNFRLAGWSTGTTPQRIAGLHQFHHTSATTELLYRRAKTLETSTHDVTFVYRAAAGPAPQSLQAETHVRMVHEEELLKQVQRRIVEETQRVERKFKQHIASTEDLTSQVYDRLARRLQVERERLGY